MSQKYIKKNIPKALRDQVWLKFNGRCFDSKCKVRWCKNKIDVFNYHVGHNIPESKGGLTTIENLRPICSSCNLSMGNQYSIDEWNKFGKDTFGCFNWFNYFI
jgi:5-methylcytosine-specific restriction endonuclease McrA